VDYLAVGLAGFFGAVTRVFLGNLIRAGFRSPFPFHTLVVNLTGCFILSFFLNLTLERLEINPRLRLGIGTGFLGAYTTFSTFAVESVNLMRSSLVWPALVYILSTSVGCVIFAWIGAAFCRVLTGRYDDSIEQRDDPMKSLE
jgi:CrcB protein